MKKRVKADAKTLSPGKLKKKRANKAFGSEQITGPDLWYIRSRMHLGDWVGQIVKKRAKVKVTNPYTGYYYLFLPFRVACDVRKRAGGQQSITSGGPANNKLTRRLGWCLRAVGRRSVGQQAGGNIVSSLHHVRNVTRLRKRTRKHWLEL